MEIKILQIGFYSNLTRNCTLWAPFSTEDATFTQGSRE